MWLCFNDGFLSVVVDKKDPARLMVRSRRRADLVAVVGADAEIIETPNNDYRWRSFVSREQFAKIVADRVSRIDYSNFKNSVSDHDLHELYMDVWSLHYRYGQRDPLVKRR